MDLVGFTRILLELTTPPYPIIEGSAGGLMTRLRLGADPSRHEKVT
jgi:hypothetical protein